MRMLKEYFLDRIREKYPDNFSKYDYSLLPDEFKSVDKVYFACKKHGMFEQLINSHLTGHGCVKCGLDCLCIPRKYDTQKFIIVSNKIHNNKYTYYKLIYTTIHSKVIITCPIHGDFQQTAYAHLAGQGCTKCAKLYIPSTLEFIDRVKKIHNNKYDYSLVKYINIRTKVKIICPIHGVFEQTPDSHLRGSGCPICKDSFGEKAINNTLNKLNIQYSRQYKILPHRYFYDFYLPEYNIYIEYHGRQHYEVDEFFGGKDKFEKNQRNDLVKIELIKRSSGLLIVIKYTFKTKEQIEEELIRLFTYINPEFFKDVKTTKRAILDSNIYLIKDGISFKR